MNTLELFKTLVAIPSVFPEEKQISQFLVQYLKKIGFSVATVQTETKGRNNIVATYGKAKKYLAFYGHMDTVPADPTRTNPFHVRMKGNQAWGVGTEDMKGAIAAILKTGEYAVDHDLPMKIVFCVDEEHISQGAHDVVDSGLLHDVDFMIAMESGQVTDITKPFSALLGRKGRILFEMVVSGKRAHAAERHKGINAIEQAAHMVRLMTDLRFAKHPLLGTTDVVIHSIHGEIDSFSIPDRCVVQFSLLTTPNVTSQAFQRKVIALAKQNGITISLAPVTRKTPYGDSYATAKNHSFVRVLQSRIFKPNGVIPFYTSSVADENIFANRLHVPVVSLGPIGNGGHTKDEWVDIRSIVKVEEIYKEILVLYNTYQ